jgi:low temperature requirement protein LtrA
LSLTDEPPSPPQRIDRHTTRSSAAISPSLLEEPEEVGQRVTPLELFFDLVFVFAITQVTGYLSARPSWTRLVEGLAILAVLWFAWSGYAWLGNTANSDEGLCA